MKPHSVSLMPGCSSDLGGRGPLRLAFGRQQAAGGGIGLQQQRPLALWLKTLKNLWLAAARQSFARALLEEGKLMLSLAAPCMCLPIS